jgi:hypothetical protein
MIDSLQDFFDINFTEPQTFLERQKCNLPKQTLFATLLQELELYLWYSSLTPFTGLPVDMLSSLLMWAVELCTESFPFILLYRGSI